MNWYKNSQSEGITLYHGSSQENLESIEWNLPPYGGGLGGGVYVGTQIETAEFYGEHVYELKTKFDWDSVFTIDGENIEFIEDMYGSSISVGEQIYPFCFSLNGKKYCVTSLEGGYQQEGWLEKKQLCDILISKIAKLSIDKDLMSLLIKYINKAKDEGPYSNKSVNSIYDYDDTIEEYFNKLIDDGKMSEDSPQKEFDIISNNINNILEPIIETSEKEAAEASPQEVSLDEIGEMVKDAGYKALFVEGIRGNSSTNEEMLVFDDNDLVMIRNVF